jgi:hypothetical protein
MLGGDMHKITKFIRLINWRRPIRICAYPRILRRNLMKKLISILLIACLLLPITAMAAEQPQQSKDGDGNICMTDKDKNPPPSKPKKMIIPGPIIIIIFW